jgi:hypothetical protein
MSATVNGLPPRTPGSANVRRSWIRRHQGLALAGGVASVAVIVWWAVHSQPPKRQRAEAEAIPAVSKPTKYSGPQAAPAKAGIVEAALPIVPIKPPAPIPVAAAQPPVPPSMVVTNFHHLAGPPEYLKPKPAPTPVSGHVGDGLPNSGIDFKAASFPGTTAFSMPHPELMLPQWTSVPCVLETGIITGVSGVNPFRCRTTADVKSVTGVTLMEAGTVIGGLYQSVTTEGQERIVATTANARTPFNVIVPFNDSPVADDIGQAGVEGTVNNHFWKIFGAALLLSFLDAGVSLGTSVLENNNGTSVNIGSSFGNGGAFGQVAQKMLDKNINIKPTITLKQGATITVTMLHWTDFSHVYRLEAAR